MAKNQQSRKDGGQRGMSNRDATEELERGGLTGRVQERGMKSLNINTRSRAQGQEGSGKQRTRDESEARPAAATRSQRPASGRGNEVEPAHIPGTTGRPKRQRSPEIEGGGAGEVHAGESAGTNRAVRVTNANRKRKKVA